MEYPIFAATLAFAWLMYIWEAYLSRRQRKVLQETRSIPTELRESLDETTFEKARSYKLDCANFGFFQSLYSIVEGTLILCLNGYPMLWGASGILIEKLGYDSTHEIKQSIMFTLVLTLLSTLTGLPWSLYSTFVLEERHGFNKQTLAFYVKDKVKMLLVTHAISIPVLIVLLSIIKLGGEYFYLYAWLFALAVSFFMIAIYHDYIAPLFDKFIPLPEGELRTSIEKLAASIEFPLSKMFIVEGSKRSAHSNAYFFGFYKRKVIVLYDTLLPVSPFAVETSETKKTETEKETDGTDDQEKGVDEKIVDASDEPSTEAEVLDKDATEVDGKKSKGCSDDEILAILGHELGHWKLNHNLKNIIISEVNLLLSFFVFGQLMNMDILYQSFGFGLEKPTIIGLLIIFQFIFSPYDELMKFMMTMLSRRFEFQADGFAVSLKFGPQLQRALIKLHEENLGFPVSDPIYSAYHYSHPPLLERLRALKTKQE